MKHLKTKIGITGLILMLVFACKSNKYSFEYNLEKGATYKQILSTESKSTQSVMGQEMNTVINITVATSVDVNDVKDDSYIIDEKIDAMRMDMEIMGSKVSFSNLIAHFVNFRLHPIYRPLLQDFLDTMALPVQLYF